MYLTHYGRVGDVPRLGAELLAQLDAMVDIGQRLRTAAQRHEALKHALQELYVRRLRSHGSTLPDAALHELLALDVELNAQGIAIWLDRGERQ
jgi:hypothetical protein